MLPLMVPGKSPTVFDTFAASAGYPNASKVGKVMSDPEPTTVLTVPAAAPAARIRAASSGDIGFRNLSGAEPRLVAVASYWKEIASWSSSMAR